MAGLPSAYDIRVLDAELPILGTEPLVVEFANTLYGDEDFLGTPELAGSWFTAAGVRPARDTAAARALRDSVHALFTATIDAAALPETAIAYVNTAAARAPTSPQLVRRPAGDLAADRRGAARGDAALLGGLAGACIELLTDDRARLLRRCAGPGCCLFFVQHHKRRRYCHESCAHRDRQARYYRRRSPDAARLTAAARVRDTHVPTRGGTAMPYAVDFGAVSTVGLESSPVADALAGLRANEARYFKNKYDHTFTVEPASDAKATVDWVHRILEEERGIVISSPPLEATAFEVENTRWAYVFYESGLSINVMYAVEDGGKRAVGFKLSDGMDVPAELESFKFARQKSKLAGTIRGSYFVIKKEH